MSKQTKKPVKKSAKKVDTMDAVRTAHTELINQSTFTEDFEKFQSGTMAAGRRIRKNLQAIKKAAQSMRIAIQEHINQSKA